MDNQDLKKLKVTLVRNPIVFSTGAQNNEATPALAYAYIGGYLRKKRYDVVIVDAIAEGLNKTWPLKKYPGFNCQGITFDEIISMIPKDSDVIAFSAMFSGEWPVLRDIIIEVRKNFPDALLVAGGEHTTAMSEYCLRDCPALDVCVRGEGERTFYRLLEVFEKTGSFKESDSISYLEKDGSYREIGNTLKSRILDIDTIPWPYWPKGYLEKFWAAGKSYGISSERDMPFVFSRGCPYNCTFCSNSKMWTQKYVMREIDDVINEIKYYIKQYKITSLQLYDLTAILSKSWIIKMCQRLIEEDIKLKWSLPTGTRSEALDEEVLTLLKQTGCNYIVYAPESGSKKVLDMIKKRVNLNNLTKSALTAKKLGMACRINLIIGFPGEKWKDIFKTILYGIKMAVRGIDEVPLYIYSPYPGSEMFDELMKDGKIKLNDDYFFNMTSMNGNYFSFRKDPSYHPDIGALKLRLVRITFILLNYGISYLLYPSRIVRTIKNLFSYNSTTVFEHRIKDLSKRIYHRLVFYRGPCERNSVAKEVEKNQ